MAMRERTRVAMGQAYAVLPVEDYVRAKRFYDETLGFDVEDMPGMGEGYGVVHAGSGSDILLYERPRTSHEATVAMLHVDDLPSAMQELRQRGVEFEEYDTPDLKTERGVFRVRDSESAWFRDTEGNILSIYAIRH